MDLNKHMPHLLLYYRYLSRLSLEKPSSGVASSSHLEALRKLFDKLETAFDKLIADSKYNEFFNLSTENLFLFGKSKHANKNNSMLSVDEVVERAQKLLIVIDTESGIHATRRCLRKSNAKRIETDTKDTLSQKNNQSLTKDNDDDERQVEQLPEKSSKPKSKRATSLRNVSLSEKEEKKSEAEEGRSSDSKVASHAENETISDAQKSWAFRSNRPRRSCTLNASSIGTNNKIQDTTFSSGKKIKAVDSSQAAKFPSKKQKTIDVVPDSSNLESPVKDEPETNQKKGVEELVVNCDPFNLASNIYGQNYSFAPTSTTRFGPAPIPVSDVKYIGNKVCIPINGDIQTTIQNTASLVASKQVGQAVSAKTTSILSTQATSLPISVTCGGNAANASSTCITTSSMAGKSLGKVLLINSVPVMIRNGDKLHLPMLADNNSANQLVKNLGLRKMGTSMQSTAVINTTTTAAATQPSTLIAHTVSGPKWNNIVTYSKSKCVSSDNSPQRGGDGKPIEIKSEMNSDNEIQEIEPTKNVSQPKTAQTTEMNSMKTVKRRGRPPKNSPKMTVIGAMKKPTITLRTNDSGHVLPPVAASNRSVSLINNGAGNVFLLTTNSISDRTQANTTSTICTTSGNVTLPTGRVILATAAPRLTLPTIPVSSVFPLSAVVNNPSISEALAASNAKRVAEGRSPLPVHSQLSKISHGNGKTVPSILKKSAMMRKIQRLKSQVSQNGAASNAKNICETEKQNKAAENSGNAVSTSTGNNNSKPNTSSATTTSSFSLPTKTTYPRRSSQRIVPPLRSENSKSDQSTSASIAPTAPTPTGESNKFPNSTCLMIKRKRSKMELYEKLRVNNYTQINDPSNRNILMFRNDSNSTIIGYKCNYEDCPGFVSSRKDKVLLHIRCRHTCSKPYACKDCPKTFAVPNYLALHRRLVHSADRPYRCSTPGCWKIFKRKNSLRSHMANHFYEKPFVCTQAGCDERFIYSYELKEHQASAHYICTAAPSTSSAQTSSVSVTHALVAPIAYNPIVLSSSCEKTNRT